MASRVSIYTLGPAALATNFARHCEMKAVYGLGSNVGDSLAFLQGAKDAMASDLVAVSRIFQTSPVGPVEQSDFLNAVLITETAHTDPFALLAVAQRLEEEAGRTRDVRWGPRTLDVDLIALFQEDQPVFVETALLHVPHPLAYQRAFVLMPWWDADPDAFLPGHGPVTDLLSTLPESERLDVRPRDDLVW